ncbi:MAG: TIGR03960 family B12-binding radical SAM protein [Desulfobulbaceae bacterium]|nr:TIGR03960 family B12-binding radical SAM protein [Desulfobulbaceae bacterium]
MSSDTTEEHGQAAPDCGAIINDNVLDAILPLVGKPSRYCGNEINVIRKAWDSVRLRMVLAFPDLYEIGMSHQGLQILYHLVNGRDDLLAERVYAPDPDMEAALRQRRAPLFSLESRRPLADFDLLGITLPFELCYTNILTILDAAGLPLRAADRDERYPLVIGGGPCAFHPEPVAEFFDAILLGDGEEAILEIADLLIKARAEGATREEVLDRLRQVAGVYVPSLFAPVYEENGEFAGMRPLRPGYARVRRRVLADLESVPAPYPPLVPLSKIVHDRLGIEIARGCTRGCRFCQAGVIYRPVRERSPERILELARQGIDQGGFEEMALLSLSTGDYSCLPELMLALMNTFVREQVSVSMPSMRVGTLTPEIMAQIKRVRKTGFTLAPEAGTDRLREVINKGITEVDLLETCAAAFSLGWRQIKLYFMFGLPTETDEDLAAIPELARKALAASPGGNATVSVSAATFVPKPHTVFEREPQLTIDEGFARIDFLKGRLRSKKFNLKRHDPRQSYLEGVFSRGDRLLARVIEVAWRKGARLDAWSDHFNLDLWRQAASECGIDLDRYLRRRGVDEPLPWQHLDAGVDEKFFREEHAKALAGEYTPDCRAHGCQGCGLCDFKTVRPIVHARSGTDALTPATPPWVRPEATAEEHFVYRIDYSRLNEARYLGHLELIQVFYRALRRARLPLNFSHGFNPGPKVTFSSALPVGTESLAEYLYVDLQAPMADVAAVKDALNTFLPHGLSVFGIELTGKVAGDKGVASCYRITPPRPVAAAELDRFFAGDAFPVELVRKGKMRAIDARPLVEELAVAEDGSIRLVLKSASGQPGVKPLELLAALVDLGDEETRTIRIVKLWSREAA